MKLTVKLRILPPSLLLVKFLQQLLLLPRPPRHLKLLKLKRLQQFQTLVFPVVQITQFQFLQQSQSITTPVLLAAPLKTHLTINIIISPTVTGFMTRDLKLGPALSKTVVGLSILKIAHGSVSFLTKLMALAVCLLKIKVSAMILVELIILFSKCNNYKLKQLVQNLNKLKKLKQSFSSAMT